MGDFDYPQICIVGAGLAGLCAAIQLRRKLNHKNFTVYETNCDVGGVWFANTYPGCSSDLPSHLYSYSFAPKPDWKQQFATQSEIQEYIRGVAKQFSIYEHIQFNTQVKKLTWREEIKKWNVVIYKITTRTESELLYDMVITATGHLRLPLIPQKFLSFKGPVFHTAQWDESVELNGKIVAVVGSGPSAIQVIPAIAKTVSKLISYQRNPSWILPTFPTKFSMVTKFALAYIPGYRKAYRSLVYLTLDSILMPGFRPGVVNRAATALGKFQLWRQINQNSDLKKKLTPSSPFGCKPPQVSFKFYPTLCLPNVQVITEEIEKVGANSLQTKDGQEEQIDVLILATGFRLHEFDYFFPIEIIGKDGLNISSKWIKDGPTAYFGIMTADMPNHFILGGPGSLAVSSQIFVAECQVNFIIKMLKEMKKQKTKVVVVKDLIEKNYMKEIKREWNRTLLMTAACSGVNASTKKSGLALVYPKRSISYWMSTRKVDLSKFDLL